MRTFIWIAAVAVALVAGLVIGVWTGGAIEQDAIIEVLTRAELSEQCWEEIRRGAQEIVRDRAL
jgi:hypothetical protein